MTFKALFPGIHVYGFDSRVPGLTKTIPDNYEGSVGKIRFKSIHTPCHTSGSISLIVLDEEAQPREQAIFTGDTLFLAGCGRFFEGDAKQMHSSLSRIASLSESLEIFPGHEYTIQNLKVSGSYTIFNQI